MNRMISAYNGMSTIRIISGTGLLGLILKIITQSVKSPIVLSLKNELMILSMIKNLLKAKMKNLLETFIALELVLRKWLEYWLCLYR